MYQLSPTDRLRVERRVESLCRLGPRVVAEGMIELAGRTDQHDELLELFERYDRLTPELLRATGGDRFPPRPLLTVPGTVRRRA